MPSVPSRLLPTVIKAMRRNRNYLDPATARNHLKDVSLRPRPYGPPARLRRDVTVTIDRSGQWPIYTIVPAAREPHGNTVYVHGGGWVNEIVSQHWHLAAQIASEAQTTVTVPIYPLVPFGTAGRSSRRSPNSSGPTTTGTAPYAWPVTPPAGRSRSRPQSPCATSTR